MNSLIQHVKNGNITESYHPKANSLACFIGEAELRFATPMFKPHYTLQTASLPHYFDSAKDLAKFVRNHANSRRKRPEILSIRSFPAGSSLDNQTYLELINL